MTSSDEQEQEQQSEKAQESISRSPQQPQSAGAGTEQGSYGWLVGVVVGGFLVAGVIVYFGLQ